MAEPIGGDGSGASMAGNTAGSLKRGGKTIPVRGGDNCPSLSIFYICMILLYMCVSARES